MGLGVQELKKTVSLLLLRNRLNSYRSLPRCYCTNDTPTSRESSA